MNTAIIILAAGSSSRMGKPKQLLVYQDRTLLDHAIQQSLKTKFRPVIVVLGAYAEQIQPQVTDPEVICTVNQQWEMGMGSSIACGLRTLLENDPAADNVILSVADQVHLSSSILQQLEDKHLADNKNIVTAAYANTTGTPTLFNKQYFSKLLTLDGPAGAKALIAQHIHDTVTVPFEAGSIDIDTETDYNNLIHHQ